MRWCVIPARGGSKRISRKNIRRFCGVPIMARSIAAAVESGLFDGVVVSTDDDEIAAVATASGAVVPFRRSVGLADDHTPTNPVVADAVVQLRGLGHGVDMVCCLYPTAPFVTGADLTRGLEVLGASSADFSFAATTFAFPVQRALLFDGGGLVTPMFPEHIADRSQDLAEVVHDAGQFYWGDADAFGRFDVVFAARAAPVLLPRRRVQDIDTLEDWEQAEAMFEVLGGNSG